MDPCAKILEHQSDCRIATDVISLVHVNCACKILRSLVMESSITKAARRLGFLFLKNQQKKAILSFLEGNHVFGVSLPTGSGKSLCFALLPFVFDEVLGRSGSIAIVVSPLISLMKDQVHIYSIYSLGTVHIVTILAM